MNSLMVYQGQSVLDKVIEATGNVDNAFEMAYLNGISLTDDVFITQVLKTSPVTNKRVVAFFNEYNRPATAITADQLQKINNKGIGFMRIRTNFIVG